MTAQVKRVAVVLAAGAFSGLLAQDVELSGVVLNEAGAAVRGATLPHLPVRD